MHIGLPTLDPHSVTDADAIRNRLDSIRNLGYGWVYEEFRLGINSIAAPVFWRPGLLAGAIHVHGPSYRFPRDGADGEVAETVRSVAEAASDVLHTAGVDG